MVPILLLTKLAAFACAAGTGTRYRIKVPICSATLPIWTVPIWAISGSDTREEVYLTGAVPVTSPAIGARNQVGIGLSYRPASLCSLATQFQTRFLESIPRPTAGLKFSTLMLQPHGVLPDWRPGQAGAFPCQFLHLSPSWLQLRALLKSRKGFN